MIRRAEEVRVREVVKPQGGKGSVFFHDWLLPEEAPGHGRVFSKVVVPPGASIAPHAHHGEFEAFYVMSGTATVTDGDTIVELHPGDMNLCSSGETHGVENRGETDLEILALIMKDL